MSTKKGTNQTNKTSNDEMNDRMNDRLVWLRNGKFFGGRTACGTRATATALSTDRTLVNFKTKDPPTNRRYGMAFCVPIVYRFSSNINI